MAWIRWCAFLFTGIGLAAAGPPQVETYDAMIAKIKAAGDAARHNADAVFVVDDTQVTVRSNGIGTARKHQVIKILREAAIRGQSVQVFPFDPHTNRLEVKTVRVYRSDGTVENLPLETALVEQPQPSWGVYWGTQQYLLAVPRLEIGDAVETISEMTGFNVAYLAEGAAAGAAGAPGAEVNARGEVLQPPVPGHWHDEVQFWSSLPIIEKRYTVRAPKDKPLQYEFYNGLIRPAVLLEKDEIVYSFEMKDLKPLAGEPSMENWPNVAPKLLLATLPSWEDKARWLYEVSESKFQADDAIRAKVKEITAGLTTDEEKYTALNHWVAENIRYAGTSRGMCEGYTIHDIKETFHDRAGVCKDKAGMLVGMLRVAGFESYLVMTMARQRVDRIPADQFNHAVTCVRNPDGSLILLDPTWMPKSRDNWSTLEPLQHVVYGVPEGKELSQSPDFPPETNWAQWRGQTTLGANNELSGRFTFTAIGAPETGLRRALAGMAPERRQRLFDSTAQRLAPNAQLMVRSCTDPVDFREAVTVDGDYHAAAYAVGQGRTRVLALPMMQTLLGDRTLGDLFGVTGLKERKYGLKLRATRRATIEETIQLPPGWEVVQKPDPVKLDGPSAALTFNLDASPGKIHYTCELTVKRWTIPPEEYANYKEVIEKYEELTGRVIACRVEDGHAHN